MADPHHPAETVSPTTTTSEPILLTGHRYIVGRKEYVVVQMTNGEKCLGRVIGWADRIGRPTAAAEATYVVVEGGERDGARSTLLIRLRAAPNAAP
ncbi:MAG: hypothetical protein NZ518_05955 [Dehalococcoidia bacterium]|nr:hypothetical protein [Dehalococcoidia bacterium]